MSQNNKMMSFSNSKGLPEPNETFDKKGGFVKWGAKNDYPFFLLDMYNGSAWHQGILNSKTHYISGGGVEVVNGILDEFLENKHSDFKIEEVVKKLTFDFELFNSIAVVGTWNRDGSRVARWEYVDAEKIRSNGDESLYFYSDDWGARKQTPEDTNYKEYKPLDLKNKVGKFIIYYKSPTKQSKGEKGIYPKPTYFGGLTAINTDYLISKWHLHGLQNGFKGGSIVNFASGEPDSDEKKRAIRDDVKGSTTSIEDTNQVIITFSDGQENAPSVVQLNGNDLADRYNLTEKSVQQNILVCHSATNPMLFGIKTEGQLGGATELLESYEIFKSTYIQSRQTTIEWLLNLMVELSGFTGTLKLKDAPPVDVVQDAIDEKSDNGVAEIDGEVVDDVSGTAMNGAQISSLVGIVEAIGLGTLSADAGVEVILASFPTIDREQARKIVGIDSDSQQFRSADKDLKVFKKFGESKDKFKVVRSISVSNDFGSDDVAKMESNNFSMFFDKIGDIRAGLTDLDKNVLELLRRGEDGTSISNAIDEPIVDVAKSIDKLNRLNLLVDNATSTLGEQVLDGLDIEVDQFEVRYSYEVKSGLGKEVIPTTRDFCRELIGQNRMYLRSEIDQISSAIGRDVWRYRGGFYHNDKIGRTTPWCRHEWRQSLVIKQ